jgi:hypothetical protein
MTGEQRRVYQGALRLGATYGLGRVWTAIAATGGTPAADPTIAVSGLVYGYALRNNRDRERASLPQIPIFTAEWLFIHISGTVTNGMILVSADDSTRAFSVIGAPSTDQGWTLAPLAPAQAPDLATVGVGAGYQAGLRIGAW